MLDPRYVAGFVDADGCIQFTRQKETILPRVLVTNTDREILEDLQRQYGGDISQLSVTKRKPLWKPCWCWRIANDKAVKLVREIEPYLRLKHPQALLVFGFAEAAPGRGKGKHWDAETREFLFEKMRWLNKRGLQEEPEPVLEFLDAVTDV